MKEILDIIHNTIYQFFDVCGDDEEVSMSEKDKLLLEVNKAICNNLKALEQQPCDDAISRSELLKAIDTYDKFGYWGRELIPLVSEDGIKLVPYIHYDDVIKCIKSMPSVQPEQKIIRCKDCNEWHRGKNRDGSDVYSDEGYCSVHRIITGENYYCGDAERR